MIPKTSNPRINPSTKTVLPVIDIFYYIHFFRKVNVNSQKSHITPYAGGEPIGIAQKERYTPNQKGEIHNIKVGKAINFPVSAGHPDHIRDGRVIYYQTWQRIPSQTGTSEYRAF